MPHQQTEHVKARPLCQRAQRTDGYTLFHISSIVDIVAEARGILLLVGQLRWQSRWSMPNARNTTAVP
jgi:hypothetical protein